MMKFNREQVENAAEILEGAKVMVLNRDFDDFQNAIITALNTFALVKELTEKNEKLNERLDREAKCQYDLATKIVDLRDDVRYIKVDSVLKMQLEIMAKSEYGTIYIFPLYLLQQKQSILSVQFERVSYLAHDRQNTKFYLGLSR